MEAETPPIPFDEWLGEIEAEIPPISFDEWLSEMGTQTDVISSPAPFGGMIEEQTDSLWSTIDLNKEVGNGCSEEDALQAFVNKMCTYVFFTNHLIKLLNTPNLTLACITFFTIPSEQVLHPGWFEQSWYDQPRACPLSGGL